MARNDALLTAVQPHPAVAVTVTLPDPVPAPAFNATDESEKLHPV
jgi:hypothetical protein